MAHQNTIMLYLAESPKLQVQLLVVLHSVKIEFDIVTTPGI